MRKDDACDLKSKPVLGNISEIGNKMKRNAKYAKLKKEKKKVFEKSVLYQTKKL
jgi:hypothetical protein